MNASRHQRSPSSRIFIPATQASQVSPEENNDLPYLLSVKKAAEYLGRTEKAVRHLYERRILTPLRIDARVFIDRREIDAKYAKARLEVY